MEKKRRKRGQVTKEKVAQIYQLRATGASLDRIAELVGLSRWTVCKITKQLREAGLELGTARPASFRQAIDAFIEELKEEQREATAQPGLFD